MREPLNSATALDPARSVVVEACAGSGKTWLLVSRMIRLLLAGAAPSELLAITFTRRAAQEMTDRLHAWLRELALEDDAKVRAFLRDREIPEADIDALLPRARSLLETVLTAQPGPTVTTFHGWFLDLLRRAPLDAGLPWGAALLERERLLQDEVRDELLARWASAPDSPEGVALLALLADIGESNLRLLLKNFLAARTAWWAYGEGHEDPLGHALDAVRALLRADLDGDPVAAFWTDDLMLARVKRVGMALAKGGKQECARAREIQRTPELAPADAHAVLMKHLMTAGQRRKSQATKELEKQLGAEFDAYLRDLDALETALETIDAIHTDQRIWRLNRHGLRLGHALLDAFQAAKAQRGVLDFADAEWLAAKLLRNEDVLPALALKLDARYRHLLLDEFQDTNPLQWQALSAWLSAAHGADNGMTVFMVGDPKQAIYRFRGSEARVFDTAADFLRDYFGAPRFATDSTRRLAPAVVEAINPVFANLDGFAAHAALPDNAGVPGAVRACPVRAPQSPPSPTAGLRNPLTTPRDETSERAVHEEARTFARVLKDEVLGRWGVADATPPPPQPSPASGGGSPNPAVALRAARPGDVLVLVRKRTHLRIYERELEAAGIPFITSRRGGLLHALEARDLIALLDALLLPHAHLKLAHALKSPLFACDDDALLAVFAPRAGGSAADDSTRGWERLHHLAARADCPPCLARAARLLERWRAHVGILPVHDLLDRIYFEGDLEARYAAAVPPAMRPQVGANLRAFMQLALTQDAGRYPTLAGFVRELATLVDDVDAAPGEGLAADGEDAVRLLTIHAAKGLEAPIVWLLGGSDHQPPEHHAVLAPWPPDAPRPSHFSLFGTQAERGTARTAWFETAVALAARESDNLLYVATTRAKQALFVSGDAEKNAWLDRVIAAWSDRGLPDALPEAPPARPAARGSPSRLSAPAVGQRMAPPVDTVQTRRGELFHACLERHAPPGAPRDLTTLAARLGLAGELATLEAEAQRVVARPDLAHLFDPARYLRAHNELPLLDGVGRAHRVDRVVEHADSVWVLDYKTGPQDATLDDATLAARHREQLDRYRALLAALYPGRPVRAGIVDANGRLVTLDAA